MRAAAILAGLLACLAAPVGLAATGLPQAYQEALRNDADYGAAIAANEAAQEESTKGRAGLLPMVSISGTETQNQTTQRSLTLLGRRSADLDYNSSSYGISLRQPLYRPHNWAGYLQGEARVGQGDAVFAAARQDLILRTATAYLDVLLARDNLDLIGAQKTAIQAQLAQADRLYAGGEGTLTDVNDARARHDMTLAQEIESRNAHEVARRTLERIIGREPDALHTLAEEKLSPVNPDPDDMQQWIGRARENNPEVQAKRFGVDIVEQDVSKAASEHKPTVDLIASRTKSDSENNVSINTKYDTTAVGVQVSIPLFAGGYVSANVRQADARLRQARQELESTLRKVTLDTRQNYLNVINGVAQIKAYEQAVRSNEAALLSTRKSYSGGLRTNLDVLNAEQQLYVSRRDLAKARYTYILNWLKLKADVGALGEADVNFVGGWLSGPPVAAD